MNAKETIEALCDRTDLSRSEILKLANARRSIAPTRELIQRHGRTWQIQHDVHGCGGWDLASWKTGTNYSGETHHTDAFSLKSRDEALALIESDFAAGRYYR